MTGNESSVLDAQVDTLYMLTAEYDLTLDVSVITVLAIYSPIFWGKGV